MNWLQENVGETLQNIDVMTKFLNQTPKSQATEARINRTVANSEALAQ